MATHCWTGDRCLLRNKLDAPEAGHRCKSREMLHSLDGASAVHAHQVSVVREDGGRDVLKPHTALACGTLCTWSRSRCGSAAWFNLTHVEWRQVAVQVPGDALPWSRRASCR